MSSAILLFAIVTGRLVLSSPVPQTTTTSTCVAPNMLINGDFETNAGANCNSAWCVLSSDSGIAPWSTSGSNPGCGAEVDTQGTGWTAFSGSWSVDLNGQCAYQIGQLVSGLIAGQTYTIQFQLTTNNNCNDQSLKSGFVQTSCSSSAQFSMQSSSSGSSSNWQTVVYSFQATSETTYVTIGSSSSGTCGPVIDAVTLTQNGYSCNGGYNPSTTTSTTYSASTSTTSNTYSTSTSTTASTSTYTSAQATQTDAATTNNHIVHYTCMQPGDVPFMNPQLGANVTAGINYIAEFASVSPAAECNALFPATCNGHCQASKDRTETFSCFLNGIPVMDATKGTPQEVIIWWGFDLATAQWACNKWVPACNNQCNAE